jgi:hypothetical protein
VTSDNPFKGVTSKARLHGYPLGQTMRPGLVAAVRVVPALPASGPLALYPGLSPFPLKLVTLQFPVLPGHPPARYTGIKEQKGGEKRWGG